MVVYLTIMVLMGLFWIPLNAMAPKQLILPQETIPKLVVVEQKDYCSNFIKRAPEYRREEVTRLCQKATLYAVERGLTAGQVTSMLSTINCESGFNANAKNLSDIHANSVGSYGVSQFAIGTIRRYGKQIGLETPDPLNPDHALPVMAYMFSIGEARQWTCYRNL